MTTQSPPTPAQALAGFDEAAFTAMPGQEPALLASQREQAFARYLDLPNPTARDEEYRRTDPALFKLGAYARVPAYPVDPREVHSDWEEDFDMVIAVGDGFTHIDDRAGLTANGLSVCTLAEAAVRHADLLARHLHGPATPAKPRKFLELNAAFWNVGFFIHVPKGLKLPNGILISYTGQKPGAALLPRVVVVAEEGSEFTLAEHFQSTSDDAFLCVSAREFYLDPGAHVKLVSVQEWGPKVVHIGEDWARVRRDATVDLFTMTLGGRVSKMSVGCDVCERNANAYLGGLYFAHAKQHFDQMTLQMHSAPDTFSKMLYKGAAKDRGYSVYQGVIRATKGSIGVDAYQTNNNLILDSTARTDSIPGLIIDADDLACSHGATIGNLDAEQLYYLQSRGVPLQEARRLLVLGFFEEIVERVPYETVRDLLHQAIERKLGELTMGDWKQVATLDDFKKDDRLFAEVADQEIAIFKGHDGNLYAVSPWCTHQRVSMMNGWIEGCELTCPLHGARFDLKTGKHLCAPAPRGLQSYPLKVENGNVFVQVE